MPRIHESALTYLGTDIDINWCKNVLEGGDPDADLIEKDGELVHKGEPKNGPGALKTALVKRMSHEGNMFKLKKLDALKALKEIPVVCDMIKTE